MYEIKIGLDPVLPTVEFFDYEIESISTETSCDLIADELSTDSISFTVFFTDLYDVLPTIEWGTPIWFEKSGSTDIYYFKSYDRIGSSKYVIEGVSALGAFEHETYYGGIYNGERFGDVVNDIMLTNGFKNSGYSKAFQRGLYGIQDYNAQGQAVQFAAVRFTSPSTEISSMSKRTMTRFTLNKFLGNDVTNLDDKTDYRVCLFGMVLDPTSDPTAAPQYSYRQYGMYMDVSRASTSDPWPDFGEVFVAYGDYVESLGTPTEATTYLVDINPSNQSITVNDDVFSITTIIVDTPMQGYCYYGGGALLYAGTSGIGYSFGLFCDIAYEYYRIYTYPGELIADVAVFEDAKTERLYFANAAKGHYEHGRDKGYGYLRWCKASETSFKQFYVPKDYWRVVSQYTGYASSVTNTKVYGWIGVCTKREAIHQLLIATGISVKSYTIDRETGAHGMFFFIPSKNVQVGFSTDQIFEGGTVQYQDSTNVIEVTERSYIPDSSAPTVVYDNDAGTSQDIYYAVYDSAPIYGEPETSGLTLFDYMCNAAIVSGSGTLTAAPYTVGESVVSRHVANDPAGRTISVRDATMITAQNSESCLDRLEAFYASGAYKIMTDVLLAAQKCGNYYPIYNPFRQSVYGFMTRASTRYSSIARAACEFLCNYDPPGANGGYTNFALLTYDDNEFIEMALTPWTVPASVFQKPKPRIRVVLIGGGSGGNSGYAGENGSVTPKAAGSVQSQGGNGGECGAPGKILEFTIDNPQQRYYFFVAAGGTGASTSSSHEVSNSGQPGGATVFSKFVEEDNPTWSSEDGAVRPEGYTNVFNNNVYAKTFKLTNFMDPDVRDDDGLMSGQGAPGGYVQVVDEGVITYPPRGSHLTGNSPNHWSGGLNGSPNVTSGGVMRAGGGCGGGAGIGSAGANGTNGGYSSSTARAGNGGNGGNATWIPPKATDYNATYYGYGGHGGGGGGGGGNSGWVRASSSSVGTAGTGGYGGRGGAGGDGCILIYY